MLACRERPRVELWNGMEFCPADGLLSELRSSSLQHPLRLLGAHASTELEALLCGYSYDGSSETCMYALLALDQSDHTEHKDSFISRFQNVD